MPPFPSFNTSDGKGVAEDREGFGGDESGKEK
jgi:hypothetical protein